MVLFPQLASIVDTGSTITFGEPGIKKFNSTKELSEYLQKNTLTRSSSGGINDMASPANTFSGTSSSEKSIPGKYPDDCCRRLLYD